MSREDSLADEAAEVLARKVALRSALPAGELAELRRIPWQSARLAKAETIVREGERPTHSVLLLEGYAARHKVTLDGERQIVSIHVPGDFIDLQSAILKVADHSITAVGPVRLATVAHETILGVLDRNPGLARALWRDHLVEASIGREWLLNVGRRDAYARTAHLLCEIGLRLEAMGLSKRHRFVLGMTQTVLADTLGLTPVHMNRVIQRLRGESFITTHGTEVCVDDWGRLAHAGGFDPSYLYLPD